MQEPIEVPVTEDVIEETPTETVEQSAETVEPTETQEQPQTELEVPELTGKSDFAIPEGYQEKGWVKNIKSEEDLWKLADNSQSLIGKKQLDGSFDPTNEDQLNSFYEKIRPADKGDYEFPEGTVEDEQSVLSESFYNNGLSNKQASKVMEDYRGYMEGQIQKAYDPQVFTDSIKTMFGDNAQKELQEVTSLINDNTNADLAKALQELPSAQKANVYGLLSNIKQAYGAKEGGVSDTGMSSEQAIVNPKEAYEQAMKDREELSRRPHSQAEADEVVSRINNALMAMNRG